MRTISVIGARTSLANSGWYNPETGYTELPYGISCFKEEGSDEYVIGYIIYDSLKDISDNGEISVETLFDLIDEFAHETNITSVKYITIQIEENAV